MIKLFTFLALLCASTMMGNMMGYMQKHYVPLGQVELHDEAIIVHLEEGDYAIDAICADRGGIYFFDEMVRCPKCYRPINPKNTCQNPNCR